MRFTITLAKRDTMRDTLEDNMDYETLGALVFAGAVLTLWFYLRD